MLCCVKLPTESLAKRKLMAPLQTSIKVLVGQVLSSVSWMVIIGT